MLPIIDTHFHVYDYTEALNAGLLSAAPLQKNFTMADYRQAMTDLPLSTAIGVQVHSSDDGLPELDFMRSVAAGDPLMSGYIAWLPVDDPDCADLIDAFGADPFVVGIRYSEVVDAEGTIGRLDEGIRGARHLARAGLVYDISVRPRQYEALAILAGEADETRFVLGHMGKPDMQADEPEWRKGLERLARVPNIVCKMSAHVLTPEDGPYCREKVVQRIRHAYQCFGPERIVFGSNYPTCLISTSISEWCDILNEALSDCSEGDLSLLYSGNARSIYNLIVR